MDDHSDPFGLEQSRAIGELEMLLPGDETFEAACVPWSARHRNRPVAIVRPASTEAVCTVVEAAAARGQKIAIQATGHGPTREADGAILLDLSRLTDVRVDAGTQRAIIGGGANWEAVLAATTPHGLAPVLGSSPKVGAVGYVLGGGVGNIERLYRDVPRRWGRYVFSDRVDTRLLPPAYGDSSGVRGAAWLWDNL